MVFTFFFALTVVSDLICGCCGVVNPFFCLASTNSFVTTRHVQVLTAFLHQTSTQMFRPSRCFLSLTFRLVLDLDHTLVAVRNKPLPSWAVDPKVEAPPILEFPLTTAPGRSTDGQKSNSAVHPVRRVVVCRPHLVEFLDAVRTLPSCALYLFTAAEEQHATRVLTAVDPLRVVFSADRVFHRSHTTALPCCVTNNDEDDNSSGNVGSAAPETRQGTSASDLVVLGKDLRLVLTHNSCKRRRHDREFIPGTFLVDDTEESFALTQPGNGILVRPFYDRRQFSVDDACDGDLLEVLALVRALHASFLQDCEQDHHSRAEMLLQQHNSGKRWNQTF